MGTRGGGRNLGREVPGMKPTSDSLSKPWGGGRRGGGSTDEPLVLLPVKSAALWSMLAIRWCWASVWSGVDWEVESVVECVAGWE